MATTAEHVATIVDLAGQADTIIAQLKPILEAIEAEEAALFTDAATSGETVTDAISGRRRLAQYAQGQVFRPEWSDTVEALARKGWEAFL